MPVPIFQICTFFTVAHISLGNQALGLEGQVLGLEGQVLGLGLAWPPSLIRGSAV